MANLELLILAVIGERRTEFAHAGVVLGAVGDEELGHGCGLGWSSSSGDASYSSTILIHFSIRWKSPAGRNQDDVGRNKRIGA